MLWNKGFCVVDLVTGQKTTREAGDLYEKVKTRLAIGGFKLRKWLTNSEELRAKIMHHELRGESNIDKQIVSADDSYAKTTLGAKAGTKNEKVLGQSWNCEMIRLFLICLKWLKEQMGYPLRNETF